MMIELLKKLLPNLIEGPVWRVIVHIAILVLIPTILFSLLVVYLLVYQTNIYSQESDILTRLTPLAAVIIVLAVVIPYNYGMVRLVRELTRERAEAEELRVAAEKASEARSRFVAYVSHEIRNPLNGITGIVGAVDPASLDPENAQRLALVKEGVQDLHLVLADLLELSKIEKNAVTLRPTRASLRHLMEAAAEFWRERAMSKGLALELSISQNFPDWVKLDEHRFRQVLNNLVSNAIKYTIEGGVTISADCNGDVKGDIAAIHVSDTGRGIPETEQERIFLPYAQIIEESDSENRSVSTGLGLPISRELARLMGGDVMLAESSPEGSKFSFRFRFEKTRSRESAKRDGKARTTRRNGAIGKGKRALVADDGRANCIVARENLTKLGFDVGMVFSGRECLDHILDGKADYDLLLLDDNLGDMNSEDVLAGLEDRFSGKIVSYTGDNDRAEEIQRQYERISGFVSKPIIGADMSREIERVFAG